MSIESMSPPLSAALYAENESELLGMAAGDLVGHI
jgi:hypothetical protein